MANDEHVKILRQGVEVWNRWRDANPEIFPDLNRVTLNGAWLYQINLNNTNLNDADLIGANLFDARLNGAKLDYAKLQKVNLQYAKLNLASLSYANLENANLNQAKLNYANLSSINLRNANLTYTSLREANLMRATLGGAIFIGANLRDSNLVEADLSATDFSGANLGYVQFRNVPVVKTNFDRAHLNSTVFADIDLSTAINIPTVQHHGPSEISISTLSKSCGDIPEVFLRGCGLSDWQVENAKLFNPDLSNDEFIDIQYRMRELRFTQAVQIKPLFISYSHSDGSFVNSIEPQLNKRGIRFWRDIHHATSGKLERQIDQAIRTHPVVLLILSANSVESDWVQHEARLARKLEQETKSDVLCPIALDDAWKTCDWPERLREQIMEYNVLDFSQWQDQAAFDRMFARLIEGLGIFYK